MVSITSESQRVAAGVGKPERLLGTIYIGNNAICHEDTGNLAHLFCFNSIQASQAQNTPFIWVGFDRSQENLLEKWGPLMENASLTTLDCSRMARVPVRRAQHQGRMSLSC